MSFADTAGPKARAAIVRAKRAPYWLDRPQRPDPLPSLVGTRTADLAVVGGGFTGLWTALLAAQSGRRVILLEGGRVGGAASGRNGGFMSHSLTHGLANGLMRFEDEIDTLLRLGHENLRDIERTVVDLGIDCDFERTGELSIATTPVEIEELREEVELGNAHGEPLQFADADATRRRVDSPLYLASAFDPDVALVDPAKLAWGLRQACLDAGVEIFERTPVRDIVDEGDRVRARADGGDVVAARLVLGTNAYPPLLRRVRHFVVPVYDYVLMSEPLTSEQQRAIGWSAREGLSDAGNEFHYFRQTADNRILWGGYHAVYHRGNGFGPHLENDDDAYATLAEHFWQTFPQLTDVGFTHAWGGAIDTCSRFSAFWGTAHGGKTGYVVGYTGLGVAATRFGALAMLDLLDGKQTERTALSMVTDKPMPFPPEPFRSIGIGITRRALRKEDRTGRRGPWLRLLDALDMGYDS